MKAKTIRSRSVAKDAAVVIEAQPEAVAPTHDAPSSAPRAVDPGEAPANDTIASESLALPNPEKAAPAPAQAAPVDAPEDPVHTGELVPAPEAVPRAEHALLVVVTKPSREEPEPPPHGPKGVSFATVYDRVRERAASMLPDHVVHVADLRMNPEGHIVLPDGAQYRLNGWARKQLASMLGLRWETWFKSTSGEERAEEVNRRFSRTPGEKKIRAWRDDANQADGVARAFLAPTFTPIDDARIFERMHTMMRGLLDDYRFTSVDLTDSTTHYTAVHTEAFDVDGLGDLLYPGFHLRNSEVGASALSLDDHWLRLACLNGLMVRVGGKRALYRTHRAIEDDQLAAALVIAVGRLPERWKTTFGWMQRAQQIAVPHPDSAIAAILDSAEVSRELVDEAQRVVLRDGDRTRYGVVQAITLVAHTVNDDPDTRFAMERLAGDYLAATLLSTE